MDMTATIERASNLSELWANTTVGDVIDSKIQGINAAQSSEIVPHLVAELSSICDYVEEGLDD